MSHSAGTGHLQAHPRRKSPVVPVLSALAAFALLVINISLFIGWLGTERSLGSLDREKATLEASNKSLQGAYELLRNKRAQLCNRSSGDVTLHWMAAAFEEGGHLRYFDSRRCEDWQGAFVKAGQGRMLNLSSMGEGCNWNGSVVFHAMYFSRTSEDATQSFRDAGAWSGYDKDCYTVQ
jgi:hypothetical protein